MSMVSVRVKRLAKDEILAIGRGGDSNGVASKRLEIVELKSGSAC